VSIFALAGLCNFALDLPSWTLTQGQNLTKEFQLPISLVPLKLNEILFRSLLPGVGLCQRMQKINANKQHGLIESVKVLLSGRKMNHIDSKFID
jgi:hypothetical protein